MSTFLKVKNDTFFSEVSLYDYRIQNIRDDFNFFSLYIACKLRDYVWPSQQSWIVMFLVSINFLGVTC